jgi:hypothetical protein
MLNVASALAEAGIDAVADTAYQGAGPAVAVPQRRRRINPDTGRYRPLSAAQKQVNAAHAREHSPGERANAQLKNWRILRKIRSCPNRTAEQTGPSQGCSGTVAPARPLVTSLRPPGQLPST